MPIRVLSEQLASQIAAGEVVERPSSVVKELVENAIDAGATTINLEIREGGRELIQIADDGCGIPASDIETAFLRHATSKLQTADDLSHILTLGFRGEALAAIAAVSQLTVVSRAEGEPSGTRLTMAGGHVTGRELVGAPQGTVIAIENLFYNLPARLKFLKSTSTEKRLIDEFVTRYALAYPHIRFRLTHNNRITFQTNGSGQLLDVLIAVYGADTARDLLLIGGQAQAAEDEERPSPPASTSIQVTGFVGPPSLHWANRTHITLFVNGRWVRDSSLTYAVIQAYHTLLPTGRYPLGIVFIEMPPEEVDVNVHPAKTEIRLRDPNHVFSAVQKAIRHTLVEDSPVRQVSSWQIGSNMDTGAPAPGWAGTLDNHAITRRDEGAQSNLDLDWQSSETDLVGLPATSPTDPQPSALTPHAASLNPHALPIMRVVGQVGAAYIITEGPDGLFLIDQHAAHERILYEKFMAEREQTGIVSQALLAGTAVHLSPPQATLLEENLPVLEAIGFQIEPFGPNAFMIRAVPALIAKMEPMQAIMTVLDDLERGDLPLSGKIEDKIILRVCKTAAVKAGQTLSVTEMEAMIQQLEACQSPHTCPHGRPTLIHLSAAQLAKQFGRI